MKKRSIALSLVLIILLTASVSAGIYFSQPESFYNMGDAIEVSANIDPILEGFLVVDLVCDGGSAEIFRGMPDEEGNVNIKFPLNFFTIQEISGDCYFLGKYFGLSQQGPKFKISKALEIWLSTDSLTAKPEEEITISGTAKRLNGVGINGEVKVTIPLLELRVSEEEETETNETSEQDEEEEETEEEPEEETETATGIEAGVFYSKVTDGDFSIIFKLKKDTPAGDYRIDVLAYEKDSTDRITSEGLAMANLKVLQILTKVEIAIDTPDINPGKTLNFKPMLIDQAGNPIHDEVSVFIRDTESTRILEKIVQSEETTEYQVPTNLTSGYYEIKASSEELSAVKRFYVNEKAIASFEIRNNTLTVTNIGNIRYKKDIQVDLNGRSFVRKVNLGLGEKQEFKLTGDGSYDVKITDGEKEITETNVALTGHAVNVQAVKRGFLALNTPIVWIFFAIVLGAGILFLFRNVLKKKSFAYPMKGKLKERFKRFHKKPTEDKTEQGKPAEKPLTTPNQAEQVLVLKGHKTKATVLVLKIKNKLNKESKKNLGKALQPIYNNKGAVYERGDYIIAVFSPLMTKTFKNEVRAVKVAELIKSVLKENNKKSEDKIEFGIGISSGEVINKVEAGKLKFTALGKLIPAGKRTAEASDEKVLLTKDAYEQAGSEIKAVKIKGGEIYEAQRVVDKERNKAFLRSFLDRIEGKK